MPAGLKSACNEGSCHIVTRLACAAPLTLLHFSPFSQNLGPRAPELGSYLPRNSTWSSHSVVAASSLRSCVNASLLQHLLLLSRFTCIFSTPRMHCIPQKHPFRLCASRLLQKALERFKYSKSFRFAFQFLFCSRILA